jgi:hypothetical protein
MNNKTTTYAVACSWAEAKFASAKGSINTTVNAANDAEAFIDLEAAQSPVLSIMIHAAADGGSHSVCADYGTGKLMVDVASNDATELCYALDRVTAPWFVPFTVDNTPLAA